MLFDSSMSKEDGDKLEPTDLVLARIGVMRWAHLVSSGDLVQDRRWKDRIEQAIHDHAILREVDDDLRRRLSDKTIWKKLRRMARFGARYNLIATIPWSAWLIWTYAVGHGFGWWAAFFLLPIPIATRVARRVFEAMGKVALKEPGEDAGVLDRAGAWIRGAARAGAGGFAFGFSLMFLQALMTWFMTPAPTLLLELLIDAQDATMLGLLTGAASTLIGSKVTPKALSSGSEIGLLGSGR